LGKALDGRDLAPFHERGEGEAGFHALAVHQHGAGPALAEAAAFFRAGETEMLAQRIEQRGARIEREAMLRAVDVQGNIERSGCCQAGGLRRGLRCKARHELSSYDKGAAGRRGGG
jgi:hypothetical protein